MKIPNKILNVYDKEMSSLIQVIILKKEEDTNSGLRYVTEVAVQKS